MNLIIDIGNTRAKAFACHTEVNMMRLLLGYDLEISVLFPTFVY